MPHPSLYQAHLRGVDSVFAVMLVIPIFFLVISFLPFAKGSEDGCILLPLPLPSHPNFEQNHVYQINATELDFTLESECLFVVDSKLEYSTVEQFVSILFGNGTIRNRPECACSDVLGVVGDIDAKTARTVNLFARRNTTLIAAVAPPTFLPVTDLTLPNILDMKPLLHFIEAVTSLLRYWNWRRVGLITDSSIYYQFAAEYFAASTTEMRVTPHVIVSDANEFGRAHEEIIDYRTHVFILLMKKSLACSLLQSFLDEGLSWPEYAWIVAELESNCVDTECARNDVFFLKEIFASKEECIGYEIPGDHNINSTLRIYFDKLLVDAISLVGNSEPLDNFNNGKRFFNIGIYYNSEKVAFYDPQLQDLSILQDLMIGPSPNGDQEKVVFVDGLSTVLTVAILLPLGFVYVTAVFILYIWFRNEPEIKATSVLVSVCMFLGCYLWLTFILTLILEESAFVCNLQVWLSGIGLSTLLIFVTLFVKMLRVYVIFLKPHSFKKKLLSNPMLLLYILLFLSPQVLVLLLWSATDTFTSVNLEYVQDHRLMIALRCASNHAFTWIILLLLYLISIMFVLVVFAFKTSEIRHKYFQDTKATNAFTFLVVFVTIQILIYWFFFRTLSLEETFSSIDKTAFVLCVGHYALVVLCPTFLFVPKVYPPFKRCLVKNKVKSKPHSMSESS